MLAMDRCRAWAEQGALSPVWRLLNNVSGVMVVDPTDGVVWRLMD